MDKQQFIRQVEGNQKAVRRFLTALCCGDSALADDLAQDAFVKAYLSIDSFREESKFTTWIFRIAYNTFVSNRRSYKVCDSLEQAVHIDSKNITDSAFDYQSLYLALDKLSDKERTAILLFYLQGYAINEIAEITESSVEAVKTQLSRGRQHLRGLLKE